MWTAVYIAVLGSMLFTSESFKVSVDMVRATAEFSINLLQSVEWRGNVMLSPVSLYNALAILQQGARNLSKLELSNVLHSGAIHTRENFGDLTRTLREGNHSGVRLEFTSKMFLAKEFDIVPDFKDTVEHDFDSNVEHIDFQESKSAANIINSWVDTNTHGKIDTIVEPEMVSHDTVMLLVNALYFSSLWEKSFNRRNTTMATFNPSYGVLHKVPTMHSKRVLLGGYSSLLDSKYCIIPFAHRQFYMLILLPEERYGLRKVVNKLRPNHLTRLMQSREMRPVKLSIPRFKLATDTDLIPVLQQLGLNEVFTGRANLRGISEYPYLKVSDIIQKAEIDVNENGAMATVATTSSIVSRLKDKIRHPDTLEFKADHPFLISILHAQTAVPLFVGRVMDPARRLDYHALSNKPIVNTG